MQDDRKIHQGIRTEVNDKHRIARVLGSKLENIDADLDEVAGMYDQNQLNHLVDEGILSGNWVSAKKSGEPKTELPNKSTLSAMKKDDLLAQAKLEGLEVTAEMDTNPKIVDAILGARK